jgi:hypothetical protein
LSFRCIGEGQAVAFECFKSGPIKFPVLRIAFPDTATQIPCSFA